MIKKGYLLGIEKTGGVIVHKVKHDKNGNPRYMVNKMFFDPDYQKAKNIAKTVGFKQCQKRGYEDYMVCTTYKGYKGVLKLIDLSKK